MTYRLFSSHGFQFVGFYPISMGITLTNQLYGMTTSLMRLTTSTGYKATVVTRNVRDFKRFTVPVFNPFEGSSRRP
jgi:hypothetical protein